MPDLPLTANHWGTYRVETREGRVTALHDFEQDPDPSPIGHGLVDVLDGPTRIDKPMIRQSWLEHGPGHGVDLRGGGPFVAVTWEKAEKLVAAELTRVRDNFGNSAIYAGSYGWASAGRFHHAQSQVHRFLNCIGGYTRSKNTYSFAAAEVIVPHVLGTFRPYLVNTTSWPSIARNTRLFVAFGGVPLKNGQINQGGIGRHCQQDGLTAAHQAGVDFVNISPCASDLADVAAEWLAIRPSTDTALMLGLAHILIDEGLCDLAFLKRYTVGFETFRAYLMGETDGVPKSADWAAAISDIPATNLRSLARRMAAERTMLSVSWSLTRQDHGEQTFWAAIALAALIGQIGLPGGGFGFGYSATNSIGLDYTSVPGAALPQGDNPVADFIPVARVSDMLLNPGETFDYDGQRLTYPDVRLVYWAGGNPFHHHQDLNRMISAWRRPDTIIVNEWCWNASAKHADIVLPCTTPLERDDIAISPRDPYVIAMSKAIEPIGEARDDYEIFRGIARQMGVEQAFTEGRSTEDWLRWLYDLTRARASEQTIEMPPLEELRRTGWFRSDPPSQPTVMLEAFRNDPETNPLGTPSGRIEIFSETVGHFGYADCLGHPSWFEPAEWLGQQERRYPLHLISNQPKDKLHSQLDHGSVSRAGKIDGREPIVLNPLDAASRGIQAGDMVRLFNARGACLGVAVIDDELREGVIRQSTGAWYDPDRPGEIGALCKHGNPNVLTLDKGTSSLAQGPIAHSCLVDVERYDGPAPTVTAFEPPHIIR